MRDFIETSHCDTDSLPVAERLAAWRERVVIVVDGNPCDDAQRDTDSAKGNAFLLDDTSINHRRLGAQTFRCDIAWRVRALISARL